MQFLHNAKLTGYSLVSGRTLATMDHFASAEDLSLWKDCLEIARQLLARSMDFCFTVRIGSSFSFSLDAQKARKHLQSDKTLGSKVKHKSPSTRKRDRKRQEQFLQRKKLQPSQLQHLLNLHLAATLWKYREEGHLIRELRRKQAGALWRSI